MSGFLTLIWDEDLTISGLSFKFFGYKMFSSVSKVVWWRNATNIFRRRKCWHFKEHCLKIEVLDCLEACEKHGPVLEQHSLDGVMWLTRMTFTGAESLLVCRKTVPAHTQQNVTTQNVTTLISFSLFKKTLTWNILERLSWSTLVQEN